MISVEFARQSKDGRITLVLDEQGTVVRSLWALMDCSEVEIAKMALQSREGTPDKNPGIGLLKRDDVSPKTIPFLKEWLETTQLDAVVWTNLPAKFGNKVVFPTEDDVVGYLGSLRGSVRDVAETYIRKAPTQVDTKYRRAIEAKLGWTADP